MQPEVLGDEELRETTIVYVPDTCVQGSDLPFYLLWEKTDTVKVRLDFPPTLELKHVFNVRPNSLRFGKGYLSASDFEVNGYFGGVFLVKLGAIPSGLRDVRFTIDRDGKSESYSKNVECFRCDVRIRRIPRSITVKVKPGNNPVVEQPITVSNLGKGTGILKFKVSKSSQVKYAIPEGYLEFRKRLYRDLNQNLADLKRKFPAHSEVVTHFLGLIKKPSLADATGLEQLKVIEDELDVAFNNDEKFFMSFINAFVVSFIKNFSVVTDLQAFLAFINSLGNNKLILLDAVDAVRVTDEPKYLEAEIEVTDLARNKYEVLKLPKLLLQSDAPCDVPVYKLLSSGESRE